MKQQNGNDNIDKLKTLTIMGTIITAATIMAMYLNSTGNMNSQYCYNADIENGQVTTMYVYERQGESLSGKFEYRYEYDAEGRVASKTVMKRDAATGRLVPDCRYDFAYTAGGYTMEHSRWNERRRAFDPADSRTCYAAQGDGLVSVTSYELSADGSVATLVDDVLALVPAGEGMMAGF